MATIGVKIELEGAKEYQQGMKNLKAETKMYDAELKNLNQTMKGSTFSKMMKENELLKGKMEALGKESELLAGRIEQATEKFGENDSRTLALKTQYANLQTEIEKTSQALEENGGKFGAVAAQIDAFGTSCDNVGQKISGVGENLTKNLTAPLVGLGAASIAAFKDVDAGLDTITTKTGASGKALEDMQDIAKDIATTIPTSFDEVGNAVGEVNTRFGTTGDELESLSKQFIEFAQINDLDVSSSIDTVQSAMAAFGISAEDASLFLDTLNKAGQDTGVNVQQLASDMTSNAAVLKEFGYSASDSAMFIANLNKQGIDSSTVLAGMKKALANSIKEGKSMDEAIADLEKTMQNADDSTEAYQEALELFGNKAGPAIAEAVKSGRLSFKKLDTAMTDFAGNVENTFDATLDPIDKFQTNLNKLKISGSKLVDAAGPMISKFFDKLSTAIDKLTSKWDSLSEGEQEQIIKIGLMVAAAGPLLVGIGKVVSAVGTLSSAVSGLVTFIAANPVMAGIVVGLGLVTAAAIATSNEIDPLAEKYQTIIDKQQEAADSAKAYNDEMQQYVDNNQGIVNSIDLQYQSEQKLVDELKNIVDENGKVKEGYEERAKVITDELSEAFGIDIQYQEGTIQNYDEILKKIDQVIDKKKAEALLSANQQEYTQALTDQKEKYENLKTAQDNLSEAQRDYQKAVEAAAEAQQKMNEATDGIDYEYAFQDWEKAQQDMETLTEDIKTLTEQYDVQAEAFYKNQAVIQNYDELQQALADGTENLDGVLAQFTYNLIENAPIDYLKQQAADAKTYYDELVADAASGEVQISEVQLEAAKNNAEQAQKILTEAVEEYRWQGKYAGEGYAEGIGEAGEAVETNAKGIVGRALRAIAEAQKTGSPAKEFIEQGAYAGAGYVQGITDSYIQIQDALNQINTMIQNSNLVITQTTQLGLSDNETVVQTSMDSILNLITFDFDTIEQKHQALMSSVTDKNEESFSQIETAISSHMENVITEIEESCTKIEDNFTYLVDNSYDWGSDFIGNFEDGIVSRMDSLLEKVKSMAEQIASYMHFSTPDKGPLKDADTWMPDFIKLLAEGIDSNKYLIDNAVKGVSIDMASVLSSPFDVDELYQSVRSGASDAVLNIYLNDREVTRSLKGMGVQFNG